MSSGASRLNGTALRVAGQITGRYGATLSSSPVNHHPRRRPRGRSSSSSRGGSIDDDGSSTSNIGTSSCIVVRQPVSDAIAVGLSHGRPSPRRGWLAAAPTSPLAGKRPHHVVVTAAPRPATKLLCLARQRAWETKIPSPSPITQGRLTPCRRYSQWSSSGDATIYALSSGHGRAGIAVIRISGPRCLDVSKSPCTPWTHAPLWKIYVAAPFCRLRLVFSHGPARVF